MIARALLTTVAVALAATAFAQPSAEEIFNKYYEACGGKAKMEAVKSQAQKGTLNLTDMGMSAKYTSYTQPPNSVNISDFEGMGVVKNGTTDGYNWSINPFQGNTLNKAENPAVIFPLLYWNVGGGKAEVTGEADVDGTACHTVKLTRPEGESTLFFAKDSGLLVQTQQGGDAGAQTTKLGDYKDVGGVKVPHTIVQEGGAFNITITAETIEHNTEIPAEELKLPAELEPLKESAK